MRRTVIDAAQNCQQDHRDALTDRTDKHKLPSTDAVNECDCDKGGEEIFGPIACCDDTRVDARDTEALKKEGLG